MINNKLKKTKKSKVLTKNWVHDGSDCLVGSAALDKKFPCQHDYKNKKTKKKITVYCTLEAHFKMMPLKVSGISDLLKMNGVSKIDK